MEKFEEKLEMLEKLSEQIKENDLPLEEALSIFEKGINLAKGLEKDISKIESKVQILMTQPLPESKKKPELELFSENDE